MKTVISAFLVTLLLASMGLGQVTGLSPANGWIQPSQTYIRIVTDTEGIYRVTSTDLAAAGFNLASVNPDYLHLIFRGSEQPIHVVRNGNQLGFFEFYADEHDGGDEEFLYRDNAGEIAPVHPNPELSQISDEAVYFLTWNGSPGLRYASFGAFNYGGYTPATCYRTQVAENYADTLVQTSLGYLDADYEENPLYVSGEGYAGHGFSAGSPAEWDVATPHACPQFDSAEVTVRAIGNAIDPHSVEVEVAGLSLFSWSLTGFYTVERTARANGNLPALTHVRATELQAGKWDFVTRLSIDYDKAFFLDGGTEERIVDHLDGGNVYFSWQNASATDSCWLYDLTAGRRISGTVTPGTLGQDLHVIIPGDSMERRLLLVTDAGLRTPLRIEAAHLEDYSHFSGVDCIIVTDRSLQSSAMSYAAHRAASPVNPQTTHVLYTDAIYDEFGFGVSTPLAIKRLLMVASQTWSHPPNFLLLWGKAQNDARNATGNLVPTWGHPAFDLEYACNYALSPVSYLPVVAVGRVPVSDNAQGQDYLAKVQLYESYSFEPWMADAAFLSYDASTTGNTLYMQVAQDSGLHSSFPAQGNAYLYHSDAGGVHTTAPFSAHQLISQGVAWIDVKDFGVDNSIGYNCDLQEPSQYTNSGKFPFLVSVGTRPGACLADTALLAERWVLEPSKGAIGYLGPSNVFFSGPWHTFIHTFWSRAFNNTSGHSIGQLMDSTYLASQAVIPGRVPITYCMVLLGDPALVVANPFTTSVEDGGGIEAGLEVYPNPFSEVVNMDLTLLRPSEVAVEVVDLAGRVLHAQAWGMLPAGTHRLEWKPGNSCVAGMYGVTIRVGGAKFTRKLIKVE